MFIDENGIIAFTEPNKNWKEYQIQLSWYFFSCFDKKVLALHKKKLFVQNIKDLWQWMHIFYCKNGDKNLGFDVFWFIKSFCLFEWFDENTWEKYFFLYKKNKKQTDFLQSFVQEFKVSDLNNLNNLKIKFENNISKINFEDREKIENFNFDLNYIVSFIFWLSLIYGKYMIKNDILQSIKIQIPLFGPYLNLQEKFDEIIDFLMWKWFFVQKNISQTNNWIMYQLSITDFEFLKILWEFYNKGNIEKIWFKNENQKNQALIRNFCQENNFEENTKNIFNENNKNLVIKTLKIV